MSENADSIDPNFGDMFIEEPLPVDGYVTLPHDKPGWGLTLNKEKLNLVRPYSNRKVYEKSKGWSAGGEGEGGAAKAAGDK